MGLTPVILALRSTGALGGAGGQAGGLAGGPEKHGVKFTATAKTVRGPWEQSLLAAQVTTSGNCGCYYPSLWPRHPNFVHSR